MKYRNTLLACAFSPFLLWMQQGMADAQATQGNRPFNPFQAQFQRVWMENLREKAKLIETLPSGKRTLLAMVTEGSDKNDPKRRLLVTHWDGVKFVPDASAEFVGTALDTLLAGPFHEVKVTAPVVVNGKRQSPPPPKSQIVTTEGVYEWDSKLLTRLFAAPSDIKMVIEAEKPPSLLMGGTGDKTTLYQIGDDAVKALPPSGVPLDSTGYARFGIGTQEFPGAENLNIGSNIRYAQSCWRSQHRWMIGVQRGNGLNATSGDILVVYTPKFGSRDKSFWASSGGDCEEAWRSEALPGRILDVRVGDPKNDGADGIVVLMATNNGKDRTLWFFKPVTSVTNGFPR